MTECNCGVCKSFCRQRPGWFMPGEAERAAEYLGMTVKAFFNKYLCVDWWCNEDGSEDDNIFLPVPANATTQPGIEYPYSPRGKCVFFKEGMCEIHAVKPYECAECIHSDTDAIAQERHKSIAMAWSDHQQEIEKLLGRPPVVGEPSPMASDYYTLHHRTDGCPYCSTHPNRVRAAIEGEQS